MPRPSSSRSAAALLVGAALALTAGCSAPDGGASASSPSAAEHGGHAGHAADAGPAPADLAPAASPRFPVGSTVTLTADHMPGMQGASATVVGAFTTTVYAVDYTPTDGGAPVEDHRWVVHEELRDPGAGPLPAGAPVTLEADHMPGMEGAEGRVAQAVQETVYMVDVTAPEMTMRNHKWVVESEMRPAR